MPEKFFTQGIKNQLPPFKSAWAMLGGIFVGSIGTHIVGTFLALFLTLNIGLSPSMASIVLATFALAVMCGQIISAPIAGRWGRKNTFIVSLLSESLAALLVAFAPGTYWALLGILLIGLSWGGEQISGSSLLAELVEETEQTEVYAWQRAAFNLAAAVGAPLGGLMFAQAASLIMIIDCIVTILFAIIIATLVKPRAEPIEEVSSHNARSLYAVVLTDSAFFIFTVTMILIWIGNSQITTTLPIFLSSIRNFSPQNIGWMLGSLGAMEVIGQLIISRTFRSIAPHLLMILGTIAFTLGFIGFALFSGIVEVTVALLILSSGRLILLPAASALTASRGAANLRPAYFAINGLSYSIGSFLGPILGGNILERWPSMVWLVFALLMAFTALFYFTIGIRSEKYRLYASKSG